MRLTCPQCASQYDLPVGVIPDAGREVRCSQCSHVWFQHGASPNPILSDDDLAGDDPGLAPKDDAQGAAPPAPMPNRPKLDPDVMAILREEAAFESAKRAEERGDAPEASAKAAPAPEPVSEPHPAPKPEPKPEPSPDPAPVAKPDPKPSPDPKFVRAPQADPDPVGDPAPRRRSGFGWGVALSLVILGGAAAVYAYAHDIAQAVPETGDALFTYVGQVDSARFWLEQEKDTLITALRDNKYLTDVFGTPTGTPAD
ncbi:MAG: zinc-ribbon domain-containing protein [Marinibacterium sp.]|nr:zinc-ribbon domain-containing protein [Marinibacterium sp.]